MKLANSDGFSFDFPDALNAFKFDETDKSKPTYHGVPMKGVDIVVELADAYLFVEVKDYDDPTEYAPVKLDDIEQEKKRRNGFNWLKEYLKYKYRDTYLYRHAEEKTDKPIHYICLLNFDNALNTVLQKELKAELPVGLASKRWKREIAKSCQVVNLAKWNHNFPRWPVTKL